MRVPNAVFCFLSEIVTRSLANDNDHDHNHDDIMMIMMVIMKMMMTTMMMMMMMIRSAQSGERAKPKGTFQGCTNGFSCYSTYVI